MHLTVAGASGYVGSVFAHQVRERGHRLSTISQADTQGYQVDQVRNRLLTLSPDFLVNCAGYTGKPNVDACESDKAACLAGNAVLPGVLAEVCNDLSIPWGHVSSGCIFTG